MGRASIIACLMVVMLTCLLSSCGTSERKYDSEANAAISANDPSSAEKILEQGLLQHPSSELLSSDLRHLYLTTDQWDELRQYLSIHGTPEHGFYADGDFYYSELASHDFHARSWKRAFDEYFMAGTLFESEHIAYASDGDVDRSSFCEDQPFDYYRNAAAAAYNGKNKNGVDNSLDELKNILSACQPQWKQEIQKITAGIDQVSSWGNQLDQ